MNKKYKITFRHKTNTLFPFLEIFFCVCPCHFSFLKNKCNASMIALKFNESVISKHCGDVTVQRHIEKNIRSKHLLAYLF